MGHPPKQWLCKNCPSCCATMRCWKEIEIQGTTPCIHGIEIRAVSPTSTLSLDSTPSRAFDGVLTVLKELHQIFDRFFFWNLISFTIFLIFISALTGCYEGGRHAYILATSGQVLSMRNFAAGQRQIHLTWRKTFAQNVHKLPQNEVLRRRVCGVGLSTLTCSLTNNQTLPGANDPFLSSHLLGITSPISIAITNSISCGVRKSNKAPVATTIRWMNLCESAQHVSYSHHTQKCVAAIRFCLIIHIVLVFLRVSNSSSEKGAASSNQESYPQSRPVNCKTEPFCAIPGFVPKVAPFSAPDSLPGAGQLYSAASWLVTVYTILESHLAPRHEQIYRHPGTQKSECSITMLIDNFIQYSRTS